MYMKSGGSSVKGTLIYCSDTHWVWLKDKRKETVRKGKVTESFVSKLTVGSDLSVAGYVIRIVKERSVSSNGTHAPTDSASREMSCGDCSLNQTARDGAHTEVACEDRSLNSGDAYQRNGVDEQFRMHEHVSEKRSVQLDPVLMRVMRPYQIEAAHFILRRLQGDGRQDPLETTNDIPVTGAILADDMGTGKTLVGLSVIWAFCRHGRGKGVVVCPSSLVETWRKEITKWLPRTLARTALFIIGGKGTSDVKGPRALIRLFASSHPSVHPLLVTSYEMFRSFADELNGIQSLSTLLADEGHRLKNAVGTKTTLALGNCIAMQRIVLTGTPVQNNLDELFAVVNFASPGYLGSLREYQVQYADPICAGKHPSATHKDITKAEEAEKSLRDRIANILLRRTGDHLLRDVLPRKTQFTIALNMTAQQRESYLAFADQVIKSCECSDIVGHLDSENENYQICENDESDVSVRKRQKINNTESDSARMTTLILPALQRLRTICSSGRMKSACTTLSLNSVNDEQSADTCDKNSSISDILTRSIKFQILRSMLVALKKTSRPQSEKIVVASNYVKTLDDAQVVAKACGCPALRIDGSVTADARQRVVDMFNRDSSPFIVMLISTRAGGVGLTLTGANRLVLLDPDWNPATDQQTIGRVWRLGQTREVFIYRLVCHNSIEQSINKRQQLKNTLSNVIKENTPGFDAIQEVEVVDDDNETAVMDAPLLDLQTVSGLRGLVFPHELPERFPEGVSCATKIETTDHVLRNICSESLQLVKDVTVA